MHKLHKNEEARNSGDALSVEVAWFPYMKSTEPESRRLVEVLDDIENGVWRSKVEQLRAIYVKEDKRAEYTEKKERLPSFYISGTASEPKKMRTHSGNIQVDIDHLGERFFALRAKLPNDPHAAAVFTSISGHGIKCVFRIQPLDDPYDKAEHKRAFDAVTAYFKQHYDVTPDPQCKNVNRHCLVSWDSDLYRNGAAEPFEWRSAMRRGDETEEGLSQDTHKTTYTSATTQTTCTTDTTYQVSLQDKLAATKLRAAYRKEHPDEAKLFETLVDRLHPATPGKRNAILVKAVTFLYRAVCPELLRDFMKRAYTLNPGYYGDTLSEHEKQVEAHLGSVQKTYPETLSDMEREFYEAYDPAEQAAFRISRDFAFYTKEVSLPPPLFVCPTNHLATRLRNGGQAGRLIERLRKGGVIEIVEPGAQRTLGFRGKATIYRWCLPYPESAVEKCHGGDSEAV